jgi:hypothetical protein
MASINVRLIYGHLTDKVTVTASSEATGFPAENAVDLSRSTQWKGTAEATITLTVDLGAATAATGLGVANHNLGTLATDGYTIELKGSTDDFAISDVLVKTLAPADDDDYFATFGSVSYRYWRIKAAKGGGTLTGEVGEFYLGTAVTLAGNPDTGGGFTDEPMAQTLMSQSLSGVATVKKTGRITRAVSMPFTNRVTAEWTVIEAIHASQNGPYKPLFYVPRNDSAAPTEGDAYMVRLADALMPHFEGFAGIHSFTVNLKEEQ